VETRPSYPFESGCGTVNPMGCREPPSLREQKEDPTNKVVGPTRVFSDSSGAHRQLNQAVLGVTLDWKQIVELFQNAQISATVE